MNVVGRGRCARAIACALVAGVVAAVPAAAAERDRGVRLFEGREAMPAQLVGRDVALPATASRCSNCHRRTGGPAKPRAATPIGPVLDPAGLRERRPRRGGPPSAYDAASLCRLLRTGIDPAQVIVDTRMPRYDASDVQCEALWTLLAGP